MTTPAQSREAGNRACARCGTVFLCGQAAGDAACWCASLPPLKPLPGRGCLCRACLEEELGKPSKG